MLPAEFARLMLIPVASVQWQGLVSKATPGTEVLQQQRKSAAHQRFGLTQREISIFPISPNTSYAEWGQRELSQPVVGCGEAGFSPDGTPALEARLHKPLGLAITNSGAVYFSDSRNNRVRCVAADGTLQTVAGSDTPGDAGDGGPATEASLNEPHGLCFYGEDILLICDYYNSRIKAVKLPNP